MTAEQMQTLNITQQVLRGLITALAATLPADTRAPFAQALDAVASAPGVEPAAQSMLGDLAQGMTALAAGAPGKH